MYDINTIVQNILYAPTLPTGFAQQRVEQAKQRYQENLSKVLINPTGD